MPDILATCGPTAIGKTYQMERLIHARPDLFTSLRSVTTRESRGSRDDFWYRFIRRDEADQLDPDDIVSAMTFRGEQYFTLRSEMAAAFDRAPLVLMAIVPSIILRMREMEIPHALINCRVGNVDTYRERLRTRGYVGDALEREVALGLGFEYPPVDLAWKEEDVELGFHDDDARFDLSVSRLSNGLFS